MAQVEDDGDRYASEDVGSTYRWLALFVALLLGVAIVVGVAGVAAPGLLTLDQAFGILGGVAITLSAAVLAILVALGRSFRVLRSHNEALARHQEDLVEAREEAQAVRDRMQDQRVAERLERLEARLEALDTRLEDIDAAEPEPVTPFGDIHEVEDLEGIGETYGDKLRRMGIVDTEDLWQADVAHVAEKLDASPRRIRRWQAQAELMALKDVGPQFAELLARADVFSIRELAAWDPDDLLDVVQSAEDDLDVSIQGAELDPGRVATWVQSADQHDPGTYRTRRSGPPGP
jgi:predicted flap endonuclease-1-like 5' DNA nuclease